MNEREAFAFLNDVLEGLRSSEVRHDQHEMLELLQEHGIEEADLLAAYTIEVRKDGRTYSYPEESAGAAVYSTG